MDQSETVSTSFLGLTVGCARCHDHKFDPITQKDYYSLFAFFNNTPVDGGGGSGQTAPVVDLATPEQSKKAAELSAVVKQQADAIVEREKKIFPTTQVTAADAPDAAGSWGDV